MGYCHPCSGRLEALFIAALLVTPQFIVAFLFTQDNYSIYRWKTLALTTGRLRKREVSVYPNSSASRQLLLSGGDVSLNPGPSTKDCLLKCLSLNAQSLKSKHKAPLNEIHTFQKLVYSNAYDIICVTEAWLKDFSLDSEILDTGYTIFRRDRAECEGGAC